LDLSSDKILNDDDVHTTKITQFRRLGVPLTVTSSKRHATKPIKTVVSIAKERFDTPGVKQ